MSFEAALKAHLQADSTISGLVADRIYPVIREQGKTVPAITYQVVAMDSMNNLDGRDDSLRQIRVQVDCWSLAHRTAMTLGDAVLSRMDTAASSFTALPLPGTGLQDYEPDTKLYRRTLEFSCWYRAT